MAHDGVAFEQLDVDGDGLVSRRDLGLAAGRLGWHWREAPLYAVLDLLSLCRPLSPRQLDDTLTEMREDPRGPYGKALQRAMPLYRSPLFIGGGGGQSARGGATEGADPETVLNWMGGGGGRLRRHTGEAVAEACGRLVDGRDRLLLPAASAVLLVIDPQRSFTEGAWMRSIGPEAEADTAPIRLAFEAFAAHLASTAVPVEAGFTRCPFPPGSYGWDRRLAGVLDSGRPYFLKPGNSAFFPPTNGFAEWLDRCIDRGRTTLVVAGCTLNSCVRVTASQVRARFGGRRLRVVVDLSLCGARSRNYLPSRRHGGASAVFSAISQMESGGVEVARQVRWT